MRILQNLCNWPHCHLTRDDGWIVLLSTFVWVLQHSLYGNGISEKRLMRVLMLNDKIWRYTSEWGVTCSVVCWRLSHVDGKVLSYTRTLSCMNGQGDIMWKSVSCYILEEISMWWIFIKNKTKLTIAEETMISLKINHICLRPRTVNWTWRLQMNFSIWKDAPDFRIALVQVHSQCVSKFNKNQVSSSSRLHEKCICYYACKCVVVQLQLHVLLCWLMNELEAIYGDTCLSFSPSQRFPNLFVYSDPRFWITQALVSWKLCSCAAFFLIFSVVYFKFTYIKKL